MFIALICLLSPFLILWLTYQFPILNKVGSLVLAYAWGCILGLTGLVPNDAETHQMQTNIATASIPFAIPLMLLSSNVRSWRNLASSFVKALLAGLLACVGAALIAYGFCSNNNPDLYARVCGMLTGLYTGGTANLASLKVALNVSDEIYLIVNTYDMAASALYLLFIIFLGKKTLRFILPDFKENRNIVNNTYNTENYDNELFYGLLKRSNIPNMWRALLLTIIILALGAGVAMLFPDNMFQAVFILAISTFAVLASLSNKVREIKRTFELGTYFILVFSVAISSQMSLSMFTNIEPSLFILTFLMTIFTLLIHIILSALLRVDTDTMLTTSVSLICSPPFVPVMSGVLKNKAILGPGIAVGLCGYAIGTYLGFLVTIILQSIG